MCVLNMEATDIIQEHAKVVLIFTLVQDPVLSLTCRCRVMFESMVVFGPQMVQMEIEALFSRRSSHSLSLKVQRK